MKTLAYALGLVWMVTACGHGGDVYQTNEATETFTAAEAPTTGPRPVGPELRTDADVNMTGLHGWIDLMPGFGYMGGTHTRLQVKFNALSRGCTTAADFKATLTQEVSGQTLTVKRVRADTCGYEPKPIDLMLNVYGTYLPALPVYVNGQEVPVTERIIY